jgi:formylglycine-generating enzyme required for sulfatase activity
MRRLRWIALVAMSLALAGAPPATAERRVALVIGNSAYRYTPELANPRNDAADIAAALGKHGFEVIQGIDLDKVAFDRKVGEFVVALKGAGAGVFFYAGHGLQVAGQNYLVPIDAKVKEAAALDLEMVRVETVHRIMERQTETNILFLDACRDNPLARNLARSMGTRSAEIGHGLARVEAGIGTLISFSTQPGNVALDGAGRNSPYTSALLRQLAAPKEDLSAILIDVRNDVMQATSNKQVPWEHVALRARFYFTPPAVLGPVGASETGEAAERVWALVKDSTDVRTLDAFRKQYGTASPSYDRLAEARIEQLRRAAAAEPVRAEGERPGRELRDCPDICPLMVVLPAGRFAMGENSWETEANPQHKVTIAQPFAVGKYEVTFAEWEACVAGGGCTSNPRPSDQGWGKGQRPVINVSWHDAKEYVAWLSRKTGKAYRLLSEAEWEYSARAETSTRYAFGDKIERSLAQYGRSQTVDVGSFPVNGFRLHDLHGNVLEWVEDTWHPNYEGAPEDGSVWPGGDVSLRVLRGGSWVDDHPGAGLRSAARITFPPDFRINFVGFRVARTL